MMLTKKLMKVIVPVCVLAVFVIAAKVVSDNPPTAKRGKPSKAPQLNVAVQTIEHENFALQINSYGTVQPRTQSVLMPQVSGEIKAISDNFREGGFFEKGEVLVKLDDRDYLADINIAKANLYSAEQALSEEQARSAQAKQDWQRLGNKHQASDLVLRKPQLLAAEAAVYSAKAQLAKAELSLERTEIKAPYTGRILNKSADIGQVVSANTPLAEIFAVDYIEVRLPIKNNDLPYINLPERYRFDHARPDKSVNDISADEFPLVTIYSELVIQQQWQGRVVRTEGAFDQNSQQLFVVAQIDDPYGDASVNGLPLKIGQYVRATIQGKLLENAIKITNKAIYQGSYVFVVKDGVLLRQAIDIAWQNDEFAVVEQGLIEGDLLVLTPLGQVNSGTPIAVINKDGVEQNTEIALERAILQGKAKQHKTGKPDRKSGIKKAQRNKEQAL
ncbi:efflux RND transporter periplasmic adaptor subunit [Thalassotalea euphylliae]|uniref:Efflux RND transporter periplasmic adaptor subunit n=1 Tax=Thalassotalea euphylliae TaxID=1655234 RepID=A0A3E0TWR1_9GAMM|nr:efflux RND transporter periplasmic adaptor subunit [Thalassotalea euphylliae]REL28899.1 efflux RND transporter periplasmic adaptor subunit [Thalassotalea euphylliae]